MEKKVKTKVVICKLSPHHTTGRIGWCIGQEKNWHDFLKRLVLVPIVLLPLILLIIVATKYLGEYNGAPIETVLPETIDKTNRTDEPSMQPIFARNKREASKDEKRFSDPYKLCYKLYLDLDIDTKNETNSESKEKFDYAKVKHFRRNFHTFNDAKNQEKHRLLRMCLKKFRTREIYDKLATKKIIEKRIRRSAKTTNKTATSKKRQLINFGYDLDTIWLVKKPPGEIKFEQGIIVKKLINTSIDPCDNIYEYACGNWNNIHDAHNEKTLYDNFEVVKDSINVLIRDLLERDYPIEENDKKLNFTSITTMMNEDYKPFDLTDATAKAKIYFRSCMKQETINRRDSEPMKELLHALGDWPMITPDWNDKNFNLSRILAQLVNIGCDVFFALRIAPDLGPSNNYVVQVDQTSLGLLKSGYFMDASKHQYILQYKSFISYVVSLLTTNLTTVENDIQEIILFEAALAEIIVETESLESDTEVYKRLTIKNLSEAYPEFHWKNYFDTILHKSDTDNFVIALRYPAYVSRMLDFLNTLKPRLLQNYLLWRVVLQRVEDLNSKFTDIDNEIFSNIFNRPKNMPRWEYCVTETNNNLGLAVGALFVGKYFDQTSRYATLNITEHIIETFIETLKENTWLDEKTKSIAINKVRNMDRKVGYPNMMLNRTALNLLYSDIEVNENSYFENTLSISMHTNLIASSKVGTLVDKNWWQTPPIVVNAYYSRTENQILFPAGLLQPPFFHKFFPKALNYGGIGSIIGHEIAHGFDESGRNFNQDAKLWWNWSNQTLEIIEEKKKCFKEQYGKYTLPGFIHPIDSVITQEENIADNGGLNVAYKAYKNWLDKNTAKGEYLPDVTMTPSQLFFIHFTQMWCAKERIETENHVVASHSPGMFRIIGTLSNSKEFAEAFKCPLNSPMNPERKCDFW